MVYLFNRTSIGTKVGKGKGIMGNKLSRHKAVGISCLGLLLMFVFGFIVGHFISSDDKGETDQKKWVEKEYHSDTLSEDCIICKNKALYANENNLCILFLNEGTINQVGINKYDDKGQLVEKEDTYTQTLMAPAYGKNNGITVTTNRDRGYADVNIDLGENKYFDMDQVVENCCEECIDKLMDDYYSVTPYDIAVLNYKTGDITLIDSRTIAFELDDYYISCQTKSYKVEKEISELDLLIFYCPVRYSKD